MSYVTFYNYNKINCDKIFFEISYLLEPIALKPNSNDYLTHCKGCMEIDLFNANIYPDG